MKNHTYKRSRQQLGAGRVRPLKTGNTDMSLKERFIVGPAGVSRQAAGVCRGAGVLPVPLSPGLTALHVLLSRAAGQCPAPLSAGPLALPGGVVGNN